MRKNIFDYIPNKSNSNVQLFGKTAIYMDIKKHCEYVNTGMINQKYYCIECYNNIIKGV